MKWAKIIRLVLSAAIVLSGSTASADLVNGGFETGDLTGWAATGTAAAVGSELPRDPLVAQPVPASGFWEPTEGSYFASLWSTDNLGADASTLSRSFTAPAGYVLSFDYFFDFGDDTDHPDTASATLNWSSGSVVLFEYNTLGNLLADNENIDWTTVSRVLPTATDYTLTFTIADIYDPATEGPAFESILGIDNVSVVPVPSALLLGALGLGYASSLLGRFRRGRTS